VEGGGALICYTEAMKLVESTISHDELQAMLNPEYGSLVKAVVDIEKNLLVVDAEMHVDEETFLREQGSKRESLWGINLYPQVTDSSWIEFDSMINLKPGLGNRTRSVDDPNIRERIIALVESKVTS